jgi:hypothetical protein
LDSVAIDGREYEFEDAGQIWLAAWHPASENAPQGKRHGSGAICETPDGRVVLISQDGVSWDHPAGRPEGDENWRETLDREVSEEACAIVESARLLGYTRGRCTSGAEEGLVLVRSLWSARVRLDIWNPQYEIRFRKIVDTSEISANLSTPAGLVPIFGRWIQESGVI